MQTYPLVIIALLLPLAPAYARSGPQSDQNGVQLPLFAITPVTSEAPTHSAFYDHVVDSPDEDRRVFAHSWTYEATTGGRKPVGDLSGERVNTFIGIRGYPGAGSIWAGNSQTHLYAGYTGLGAAGWEFDVTNQAQHRGDGFGQTPYSALNSTGVAVDTLSKFRNSQAYLVDGKLEDGTPGWNRGYVVYNGSIDANWGCAFCDYGGAYASMQSYGSHDIGLDFTNAEMRLGVLATQRGQGNGITFYHGLSPEGHIYTNDAGEIVLSGKVLLDGIVRAPFYKENLTTPTSSHAPCAAGQFTDDANYHYVCTATNTWKRVALSAF